MAMLKNEPSFEDHLKMLDMKMHFPKLSDRQFKTFIKSLAQNMGASPDDTRRALSSFLFSGSAIEGAFFSRNFKSRQQTSKHVEAEFDLMFPIGEIAKKDQQHVIHYLPNAKGFVWLKYIENKVHVSLSNGKRLNEFICKHDNGITYLNAMAFKEDMALNRTPDLAYFNKFTEEFQGPSNNIESTFNMKKIVNALKTTTKGNLTMAVATLRKCLALLQGTVPRLIDCHKDIMNEFSTCQENMRRGDFSISSIDVEEFSCKTALTNRDKSNPLLKLHWGLVAFVNEVIAVLEITNQIIKVNNFEQNIGFWGFAFLPLLLHTRTLEKKIIEYIIHLFSLPRLISQNYGGKSPEEAVKFFLDECISKKPEEIEQTLHILRRCLLVLGPRFHVLEAISYDHKDDEAISDKLDEITLNIDRVPAILVHDWPDVASDYKTRRREWPPENLMATIFESGSHIVPKPSYGIEKNESLDWRWSFSQAEMILAYLRTNKMDSVYLIFKTLFYIYIKEIQVDEKSLPSYFAKTLMMWLCEKSSEEWWAQHSVYDCVVVLLEQLKSRLYDRFLPHYFIQDLNLLENISEELLVYSTAIAESICQDPLPVILDVAAQLVEFQSSQNNSKTTSKDKSQRQQSFFGCDNIQEANVALLIAEFRNSMLEREEKFKDIPEKKEAIKILKELYHQLIPRYWPDQYEKSLSIDTSETGTIQFQLSFNSLEDELNCTNVVNVHFKGSQGLKFELVYTA